MAMMRGCICVHTSYHALNDLVQTVVLLAKQAAEDIALLSPQHEVDWKRRGRGGDVEIVDAVDDELSRLAIDERFE